MSLSRRLPIGAEFVPGEGVHFRVWAPRRKRVSVVLEQKEALELAAESGGYFSGLVRGAGAGSLYQYRLDDESNLFPDPASRFQPEGPHGPSQVVDPSSFAWTDGAWKGTPLEGQVIYELHLGTFTREGTWAAAARELPELADLGITVVEIMPIADFPGRFGWGYDGVNLFAPTRLYGVPDDCRRFVDRAHALGLGVILDVVYNHFGPDGNYLRQFSTAYFADRHQNEWGEAINFDGADAGPVREFFLANASYWIDEFHMDGLRLDATQQMFDDSPEHILTGIGRRVREAALGRETIVVAENETQHPRLVRPLEDNGYGLDALWNDDFHHSAFVAMTGKNEAYYNDFLGTPQELVSTVKWGFLYQGQRSRWQKKRRGAPGLDLSPSRFVNFIENHDQVSNSAYGLRCHELTSAARLRAVTALLLLAPGTPMLFQGQEFAASSPFLYFADHEGKLGELVAKGRAEFLGQFPSIAASAIRIPPPADPMTFARCRLDFAEREKNAEVYALHRDLLKLRREDAFFRSQRHRNVDGAVLGPAAFVVRFFLAAEEEDARLLIVNLGRDLHLDPAPEPLLAPPDGRGWICFWSSEDPKYGGYGSLPLENNGQWCVAGESAVVLGAAK